MALNWRQRKFYKDRVSIYRPVFSAPDGVTRNVNDVTYELIASDVPCHFFFTSEYAEARAPGRTKVNNLFTFDKIHFADDVEVADAYAVVINSSPSVFNATGCWILQSNPLSVPASGGRRGNFQEVFAARTGQWPKGISRP
jgi:hypothetical protein